MVGGEWGLGAYSGKGLQNHRRGEVPGAEKPNGRNRGDSKGCMGIGVCFIIL